MQKPSQAPEICVVCALMREGFWRKAVDLISAFLSLSLVVNYPFQTLLPKPLNGSLVSMRP